MFVNLVCRDDQWQYSAYPDDGQYAYQQQQDRVWNGPISDEDQPWPANRIQPWNGGAQVYDRDGNPVFAELVPDDPDSSQLFVDAQYRGPAQYINSGAVYASGDGHYGKQQAFEDYAAEDSPYAYQTLSGEHTENTYGMSQYEEGDEGHYDEQYGQYEAEQDGTVYDESGGDASMEQQYAMASTRLLTERGLPVQQWTAVTSSRGGVAVTAASSYDGVHESWTTSASSLPQSSTQDRVAYAPSRRGAPSSNADSVISRSSVQQNGATVSDGHQAAVSGADMVSLDTSRTRGAGDAPVLTNGAAAAVASQPLTSLPVTGAVDVYMGDYESKQRAAKQSQATSDKLQEDFLNPGEL